MRSSLTSADIAWVPEPVLGPVRAYVEAFEIAIRAANDVEAGIESAWSALFDDAAPLKEAKAALQLLDATLKSLKRLRK